MYLLPILRWLFGYLVLWLRAFLAHHRDTVFRWKSQTASETAKPPALHRFRSTRPKPEWVRREVLRLKALMPENGCRKIAATFCYLHSNRAESVSKSFVAKLLKEEAEAILRLRQELKNRVPKKVPSNLIWALDLTFLPTPGGASRSFLGVIDHGSRACLTLRELTSRRTVDILRVLLDLVHAFGRPTVLRTDNEPIFTSWLFRTSMWLLGVRHQRSAPFAPWQNGRIERLFLTFKKSLSAWMASAGAVHVGQNDLDLFRAWYNGVRPHQHLEGHIVPAEAWTGKPLRSSRPRYFWAWNGALTGFY